MGRHRHYPWKTLEIAVQHSPAEHFSPIHYVYVIQILLTRGLVRGVDWGSTTFIQKFPKVFGLSVRFGSAIPLIFPAIPLMLASYILGPRKSGWEPHFEVYLTGSTSSSRSGEMKMKAIMSKSTTAHICPVQTGINCYQNSVWYISPNQQHSEVSRIWVDNSSLKRLQLRHTTWFWVWTWKRHDRAMFRNTPAGYFAGTLMVAGPTSDISSHDDNAKTSTTQQKHKHMNILLLHHGTACIEWGQRQSPASSRVHSVYIIEVAKIPKTWYTHTIIPVHAKRNLPPTTTSAARKKRVPKRYTRHGMELRRDNRGFRRGIGGTHQSLSIISAKTCCCSWKTCSLSKHAVFAYSHSNSLFVNFQVEQLSWLIVQDGTAGPTIGRNLSPKVRTLSLEYCSRISRVLTLEAGRRSRETPKNTSGIRWKPFKITRLQRWTPWPSFILWQLQNEFRVDFLQPFLIYLSHASKNYHLKDFLLKMDNKIVHKMFNPRSLAKFLLLVAATWPIPIVSVRRVLSELLLGTNSSFGSDFLLRNHGKMQKSMLCVLKNRQWWKIS